MIKDADTGALKAFDFNSILTRIPELRLLDCEIETVSFKEPIDSSNMNPKYWADIAEIIKSNYKTFRMDVRFNYYYRWGNNESVSISISIIIRRNKIIFWVVDAYC